MKYQPDIALLLGIPSTREGFFARVACSDYLSTFTLDPESSWPYYEQMVASPLVALAEKARRMGIHVTQDADRQSLASATADTDVVIVLSHWKGPDVESIDIIGQESSLYKNRWNELESYAFPDCNSDWRKELAVALQAYLDPAGPSLEESQTDQVILIDVASAQTRQAERRDQVDRVFEGLLVPGNRLELNDGLHSKEDIEAAIDAKFRGILDLTTCTSSYLADYLDRMNLGAFRIVQFPARQDLGLACAVLTDVLDRVARENCGYQEARRRSLVAAYSQLSQTVRRQRGFQWLWRKTK